MGVCRIFSGGGGGKKIVFMTHMCPFFILSEILTVKKYEHDYFSRAPASKIDFLNVSSVSARKFGNCVLKRAF